MVPHPGLEDTSSPESDSEEMDGLPDLGLVRGRS